MTLNQGAYVEYQARMGVYHNQPGHIDHAMLNKAYPEAGMFFKTESEAQVHQFQSGGTIHRIMNYYSSDFDGRYPRPGAKKHIEGYYVSHPPKRDTTIRYPWRVK